MKLLKTDSFSFRMHAEKYIKNAENMIDEYQMLCYLI